MELQLATARETINYKEAQGLMNQIRGLWGGNQPEQPQAQEQPQAPQFQNVQEMAQQLNQAWRAFANLYNQQIQPLKAAYMHVEKIIRFLKSQNANLQGPEAQQVQSLIDTLNGAVQGENQDIQVLSDINQTVTELAGALGMQGGGQVDETTGQPIGQATPEENAALNEMNKVQEPGSAPETQQSQIQLETPEQAQEREEQFAKTPQGSEIYNVAPATELPPREQINPPVAPEAPAPVEEAVAPPLAAAPQTPQVPGRATPQVPGRAYLRNKAQGRLRWIQERMQQGADEATAAQEYDAALAQENARKSQYPRRPAAPMTPATASAGAFVPALYSQSGIINL